MHTKTNSKTIEIKQKSLMLVNNTGQKPDDQHKSKQSSDENKINGSKMIRPSHSQKENLNKNNGEHSIKKCRNEETPPDDNSVRNSLFLINTNLFKYLVL